MSIIYDRHIDNEKVKFSILFIYNQVMVIIALFTATLI